jgi:hypothetical protein
VNASTREDIRPPIGNMGLRIDSYRMNGEHEEEEDWDDCPPLVALPAPQWWLTSDEGLDGHVLRDGMPRAKLVAPVLAVESTPLLAMSDEFLRNSSYFLSEKRNFSVPGSFGGFIADLMGWWGRDGNSARGAGRPYRAVGAPTVWCAQRVKRNVMGFKS